MIVTQITDHVDQALGRLLAQYQNAPNVRGVITALAQHVQQIENAIYPIAAGRELSNAVGAQLDGLGDLVGLKRNGLDDPTYAVLLMGTIAENNTDGTANTLLQIVSTVFETNQVFMKTPDSLTGGRRSAPARVAFSVSAPGIAASLFPLVVSIVQASIAAGVDLVYLASWTGQTVFSMAGNQQWIGGYADLNVPGSGAPFASLIYNNPAG